MACFDALWNTCFQVNMPATESFATDVHALFNVHAGTRERKMSWVKGSRHQRRQWGWVWGIPLLIRLKGVWGSVVSSPIVVWCGAPAQNEFDAFL